MAALRQRRAGGAFVFDLVTQIADFAFGPALGDLAFDLRGDLFVGFFFAGLDFADLQQHRAEPAFHRRAHLARFEGKRCIGERRDQ